MQKYIKPDKLFGNIGNMMYLCKCLTDDSSFYPARATVTAQPMARAFFMAKSQRVKDSYHCG